MAPDFIDSAFALARARKETQLDGCSATALGNQLRICFRVLTASRDVQLDLRGELLQLARRMRLLLPRRPMSDAGRACGCDADALTRAARSPTLLIPARSIPSVINCGCSVVHVVAVARPSSLADQRARTSPSDPQARKPCGFTFRPTAVTSSRSGVSPAFPVTMSDRLVRLRIRNARQPGRRRNRSW